MNKNEKTVIIRLKFANLGGISIVSLKDEILNKITRNNQESKNYLSTEDLAIQLGVKRNTVSHYLNELVVEMKVIKINTRPVIFIARNWAEKYSENELKNEYANAKDFEIDFKGEDSFNEVVGHDKSLYTQIKKLKAAASYPGGLPVLINGQTGTGKSYIARKFFDYCVLKKYISPEGKFVSFNCAEYADNPELLASTLFGYIKGAFTGAEETSHGLFDEANNGMLFLDEVHRLDSKGQEKLFSYLDKGTISYLGDAGRCRKVNVRVVFATTEDIKSSFLATFIRRIPVQITMPPLNQRTSNEIRSLIVQFYIQRSKEIGRNIKVDNQVFSILANVNFESNVGQLKNDILLSVANALREKNYYSDDEIYVRLADLPKKVLLSSVGENKQMVFQKEEVLLVRPTSVISDLIGGQESTDYIKNVMQQVLQNYLQDISLTKFKNEAIESLNNLCDYLIFKKELPDVGGLPLSFIQKIFNQKIGYLQDNLRNDFNGNVIVAISYYFYFRQESRWKPTIEEKQLADNIVNKASDTNPNAKVVQEILDITNSVLNIYTDEIDRLFLTFYLAGTQREKNVNIVHCVLLAHGYSTASSIADTVNKIAGEPILDSFDMPINIQPEDIAKKISNYIHARHVKNGLILMVDMGSLEKIPELLKTDLTFPVVIFNNVSTQLSLFVANYMRERKPLESIIKTMNSTIYNDYRIIYPKTVKKNVIVVSCTTGVGTANKIKQMLTDSLPKKTDINIIAYDGDFLKLSGQETAIKRKYNILAIIGTINPKYDKVPFISLDQLVNGSKIKTLQNCLKELLTKEELYSFNRLILRNFTIERVINSLTILDTKAVMKNIDLVLEKMNVFMSVELSNQTRMALYVHLSCMIERIIRNQALDSKPANFEGDNEKVKYIQQSLEPLEEIYNIRIPLIEVEYIYELVFSSDSNLTEIDMINTDDF